MMRILIALLALTIPASAQEEKIPACAPHEEMVAALLSVAKESPVSLGLMLEQNAVVELYASQAGTWTVVQTDVTTGEACIKAYGTNFQVKAPPWKEQGAGR